METLRVTTPTKAETMLSRQNHQDIMMSTNSRKRRVSFEFEHDDSSNSDNHHLQQQHPSSLLLLPLQRRVKRRIQYLPLPKSSLMTLEEKASLWMQPEDHQATFHDVSSLMQDCRQAMKASALSCGTSNSNTGSDNSGDDPNKVPFAQYAEALAMTFQLCDTPQNLSDNDDDTGDDASSSTTSTSNNWNIRTSHSVGQLALWASHHTSTRGVESKLLPGLYQERQLRRSRAIQGVLQAQRQMKAATASTTNVKGHCDDSTAHKLSSLYESLTHTAKEFASALAVVDGQQALLEYVAMGQQQQQQTEMVAVNNNCNATESMETIPAQRTVTPDAMAVRRNSVPQGRQQERTMSPPLPASPSSLPSTPSLEEDHDDDARTKGLESISIPPSRLSSKRNSSSGVRVLSSSLPVRLV